VLGQQNKLQLGKNDIGTKSDQADAEKSQRDRIKPISKRTSAPLIGLPANDATGLQTPNNLAKKKCAENQPNPDVEKRRRGKS
jgi:hypothetical protein